jgi:hypothetical protein
LLEKCEREGSVYATSVLSFTVKVLATTLTVDAPPSYSEVCNTLRAAHPAAAATT